MSQPRAAILILSLLANGYLYAGVQIREVGKGQPLILLPALGCSGDVWEPVADRLAEHYHSYLISIPGFAGLPGRQTDFTAVTAAIAEELKTRGLRNAILAGHSFGGYLALSLAIRNPELFSEVVILDAYPFPAAQVRPDISPADAKTLASSFRRAILHLTAEQYRQQQQQSIALMVSNTSGRQRVLDWTLASDRETTAQAQYEMLSSDLRAGVAALPMPLLVLGSWRGREGMGVSHDSVEALLRQQYGERARISISDSARHFLLLDDPAWVAAQIGSVVTK